MTSRVRGVIDPVHCAGLVAWELAGMDPNAVRKVLREHRVRNGRTESYAGLFDIPEHSPRFLFIANAAPFTSVEDVDRLADAIEAAARAS
jgi:selenocysteine lyase/cysteine desulfurase